jgi:molybdopterin/thiamine biosynthesis adenylyltransferase
MLIPEIFERHAQLLGSSCMAKLRDSSVLVAGVGGLGSTVAQLLVRMGVGILHLVDFDRVEESNLNRQLLYTHKDIGRYKVDVAAERLREIVPGVKVIPHRDKITEEFEIPADVKVVVDCLDNFKDKLLLDDLSGTVNVSLVHAGVSRFHGQVTVVRYGESATLREIFENIDAEENTPVYPPTVTVIASIQASETVRLICESHSNLMNRLLIVDLMSNTIDTIDILN